MLNGTEGSKVGSVLAIPVGMGDKINAKVYAKYVEVTSDPTNAVTSLASSLIGAFTGGLGGSFETASQTVNDNFGSGSLIGTTGFDYDNTAPKAFLNLMFLPESATIDLDATSFAYDQISGTATQPIGAAKNTNYDELSITDFEAPDQGYVLIYLSNESSTIAEVYFDDIEVMVEEHPVIQTNSYYPFGLQHSGGYQRITAKENRFRYNGFEYQEDLGINLYDYLARQYDPAIGRFTSVDPAADLMRRHSPYNYAFDNPIRFIDPDGMMAEDVVEGQEEKNNKKEEKKAAKANQKRITQLLREAEKNGDLEVVYTASDGINQNLSDNAKAKLFGTKSSNEPSYGKQLLNYLSKGVTTKKLVYESSSVDFQHRGNNFKISKGIDKIGYAGDFLTIGNQLMDGNYDMAAFEALKAAGGTYTSAIELTKFVGETQLPGIAKENSDLAMKYYRMGVSAKSEALRNRYFKMAQQFQNKALETQKYLKNK